MTPVHRLQHLAAALALGTVGAAWAQPAPAAPATTASAVVPAPAATPAGPALSPKARLAADTRAAQQRYEADKKLCNDETTSSARLQCRRDAKTAYDQAVADAKARAQARPAVPQAATPAPCPGCGQVESVKVEERKGKAGAGGMIVGGVGGAILGHQVGGGTGKDLATVAGAVGGAYAGKKIEEKMKAHQVWLVTVAYGDGTRKTFEFAQDPGFKRGDAVRNAGEGLQRR